MINFCYQNGVVLLLSCFSERGTRYCSGTSITVPVVEDGAGGRGRVSSGGGGSPGSVVEEVCGSTVQTVLPLGPLVTDNRPKLVRGRSADSVFPQHLDQQEDFAGSGSVVAARGMA